MKKTHNAWIIKRKKSQKRKHEINNLKKNTKPKQTKKTQKFKPENKRKKKHFEIKEKEMQIKKYWIHGVDLAGKASIAILVTPSELFIQFNDKCTNMIVWTSWLS